MLIEQTGSSVHEFDSTDYNGVEQLFSYTYEQVY